MTAIPPSDEVSDHEQDAAELAAIAPQYRAAIHTVAKMAIRDDPNTPGFLDVVTLGLSHKELTDFAAMAIGMYAELLNKQGGR